MAGLQSAKEKFQLAESKEYQLQQQAETRKSRQMLLYEATGPAHDVDPAGLADALHARFVGKVVPFESVVFEGLTMPYVLEADLRKALTKLKTSKRANYASPLKYKVDVTFKKTAS